MKIALGIEYDGTRYHGWQMQQDVPSVQQYLEQAISKVAAQPIIVHCAGRTDRGVHATQQVVHFETTAERVDRAWFMGVNTQLPSDIRVVWSQYVPEDFHARFSATARRYYYVIYNRKAHSAILRHCVTWHYHALDADKMHEAIQYLMGEHDFSSFRAAECQANHGIREMLEASVTRHGDYVVVSVQANAFLHHMVRNIVGSLFQVGEGDKDPQWMGELLQLKDRKQAGVTAAPQGLYLTQVLYPNHDIPQAVRKPLLLESGL